MTGTNLAICLFFSIGTVYGSGSYQPKMGLKKAKESKEMKMKMKMKLTAKTFLCKRDETLSSCNKRYKAYKKEMKR